MKGLNEVQVIGHLGKDPEIRYTQDGKPVASFSIGANESWKGKDGQKQERTEWVNCTAFDKLAEIVEKYLKKGAAVYVSGKLRTEKYKAKDGSDRYSTKVVIDDLIMLGGKSNAESQRDARQDEPNTEPTVDPDFPEDLMIPF
jgi:single-strand DNA-binding protein